MKLFAQLFLTVLALTIVSSCHKKQIPSKDTATPKASSPPSLGFGPSKAGESPKSYKEVINEKAISQKGLFYVHKVDEKYYFEVADSLLGREILVVVRFSKVANGVGYGGEIANQNTIVFEKGPSNNLFVRVITYINSADSTQDIYRAVTNSNVNTIVYAFPIAAKGVDSLNPSYVVDVTEFLKGDNHPVGLNANVKRRYNIGGVALDRSYIQKINSFPINTEVRATKTFNAFSGTSILGVTVPFNPNSPQSVSGAVTLELNTSFLLLPKTPMKRRIADRRVGYFTEELTQYSDNQQRVENKEFIIRWNLAPRPEDKRKWEAGELVEPEKPILFYIDPATPKKWRPHLIAGVNDWRKAFEAIGFKNAIMAMEWPANDSGMSLEDSRYSVIRYFASEIENAYGPNVHDPRSGEILESHIGWYHNVMKLVHDWYFIQASTVDPRARKVEFDDDLMGDLIRVVSSHEVGHTLGLRHNMGSSSKTPVEKLRDKKWVEQNGHTASIMDYARFNYVAQPEDNIGKSGIYPRIGDYDFWAIRWGYGKIDGDTEEEQKKASDKLIVNAIRSNPRLWFGTYEYGNNTDPRTQREDLGDNAVKASIYGIKNLQRILPNLPEWTKKEADLDQSLSEAYGKLMVQFKMYVNHVSRNIGGVQETIKSTAEEGPVYEPTPKETQKDAMAFLNEQVFQTPKWLMPQKIMDRISSPAGVDPVAMMQEASLANLLAPDRLARMQACTDRFGGGTAYSTLEMLTDLQNALFSEIKAAPFGPIDLYRRALQKSYVDKLIALLPQQNTASAGQFFVFQGYGADIVKNDHSSIARGMLQLLRSSLATVAPLATDRMTKFHLVDLDEKIKRAVSPKQ